MPRAPPGLSLLLMAALAFAATPPRELDENDKPREPLKTINPWLSACDLQPASATDLKGACSAMWGPGPLCPLPCPPNNTSKSTQCLYYLEESHKEKVCKSGQSPEQRRKLLDNVKMRHCCEHNVSMALPEEVFEGGKKCYELLDALLAVDALAARISCEFAEVLYRYDCSQKYSIKHQCEDCKEAYRRWVCSSMVPHYKGAGQRVRPCLNVCQTVEQKCPYLLPGDRAPAYPTQYAGEPTFLCLDPNIPETGKQRVKSSVGDEDCCYTHCGAPGRGLCVNCPGRPSNYTAVPVNCTAGLGNSTSSCTTTLAVSSSATSITTSTTTRTLNNVLPLWTAWILLLQMKTLNNILQYLFVMCANCVRTMLTRIKTKWRPWS